MLKTSLLAFFLLFATSTCVTGAPPGFSDGDLWEVPLVAPLEDDLLLVPVSIHDTGPFLFMVDPDSPVSSIEAGIRSNLKLIPDRSGRPVQNVNDNLIPVALAIVNKMTIGDLHIRNMSVRTHPDGTFWAGGRRVHGILGRDVISDSLIYSFDRDRGKMYIGTQGHIKAPEDAHKLSFTQSYSIHRRYLAKIKLNRKHKLTMHMDFGARTSMLWPALIEKFKLPTIPVQAELVDELGTRRTFNSGTMGGIVGAGKMETNALFLLPYDDKRLEPEDLDGIIGQNFWSRYNTIVNWHQKKIWLQPRESDLAAHAQERIDRWGEQLRDCAQPACVKASIPELAGAEPAVEAAPAAAVEGGAETGTETETETGAGADTETETGTETETETAAAVPAITSQAPGASPLSLLFERAAPGTGFAYDVVVAAVDDKGKTLDLPIFLVHFRSGISSLVWNNLDPDYAKAAGFIVIDMNPVGTRGCEGSRCIYPLRAPR